MTIQIEYIIYFLIGMLAGILLEFALALLLDGGLINRRNKCTTV